MTRRGTIRAIVLATAILIAGAFLILSTITDPHESDRVSSTEERPGRSPASGSADHNSLNSNSGTGQSYGDSNDDDIEFWRGIVSGVSQDRLDEIRALLSSNDPFDVRFPGLDAVLGDHPIALLLAIARTEPEVASIAIMCAAKIDACGSLGKYLEEVRHGQGGPRPHQLPTSDAFLRETMMTWVMDDSLPGDIRVAAAGTLGGDIGDVEVLDLLLNQVRAGGNVATRVLFDLSDMYREFHSPLIRDPGILERAAPIVFEAAHELSGSAQYHALAFLQAGMRSLPPTSVDSLVAIFEREDLDVSPATALVELMRYNVRKDNADEYLDKAVDAYGRYIDANYRLDALRFVTQCLFNTDGSRAFKVESMLMGIANTRAEQSSILDAANDVAYQFPSHLQEALGFFDGISANAKLAKSVRAKAQDYAQRLEAHSRRKTKKDRGQ